MGNIIAYNNHPNLSQGLISYYKLDGNSNDSVGGNNGTDVNMTYNNSYGKINQGALFNGSSSYINLGNNSNLSFGNGTTDSPFTFSFWLYSSQNSAVRDIFCKQVNSSVGEYRITLLSGYLTAVLFSQNGNYYLEAECATVLATNTWYYATITYNGSKIVSGIKIYINGVLQSSTTTSYGTYTGMLGSSSNNLDIGRYTPIPGSYAFNGYIDEIGIWNRALSSTEVTQLYNSNNGLQYPFISTPKILSYNNKILSLTQAIDNDLQAWLNLLTVQPSSTYTNALNILIIKLKASGIWQELDRFWLFATEQHQHAQIDVKGLTTITEVNAPTWTSLSGYKFDGSTNYINTNYDISTSTKFLQDSASFGGYLNTKGSQSSQRSFMGVDNHTYTLIYPYSSVNTVSGFCNSTSGYGGVNMGDGLGLITANRNSPTNQYATHRNNIGTIIVAGQTSGPRESLSMYIGCFNDNNLPYYFWDGGLSMCYSGSGNIIPTTLSTYFQEFATTLGFAV